MRQHGDTRQREEQVIVNAPRTVHPTVLAAVVMLLPAGSTRLAGPAEPGLPQAACAGDARAIGDNDAYLDALPGGVSRRRGHAMLRATRCTMAIRCCVMPRT